MSREHRVPRGLSVKASRLWNDVVTAWELRPDELSVLEEACRTADVIDALEAIVKEQGLMTAGSMGQPVVHPAVVEARQQTALLGSLLRSLGLSDDAGASDPGTRSQAARKAARSRWSVAHAAPLPG